jgi:hypothetical protein
MITARNMALEKKAALNRLYVKRKKDSDDGEALLAMCALCTGAMNLRST